MTENESSAEASYVDDYSHIEERYEPPSRAEVAWRRGKRQRRPTTSAQRPDGPAAQLADVEGLEGGFNTTYRPGKFEEGWLLDSLRGFYEEQLITDVLALVKGGKEANVYRCRAHPHTGLELLAAKVYRPRMFRTIRNDKVYRQGRTLLTEEGIPVKRGDTRTSRAVGKKTPFGVQVEHTSWLMHEFTTLEALHADGGSAPQPVGSGPNALLMGYVGDESMAAPTLNSVRLGREEAQRLFKEVLRNVRLMLARNLIHGDLSAYNVLYWDGEITLIDFPQVVYAWGNDNARDILRRDIQRICDYFSAQGVECDAGAIAGDLWGRYVGLQLRAQLADLSMADYRRSLTEIDEEDQEEGAEV